MPTLNDLETALADSGATFRATRFVSRLAINGAIGRIIISGPNSIGGRSNYCEEYLFDGDTISAGALEGAKTWAAYARKAARSAATP